MQLNKTLLKKVWIILNKKCFIFLIYKKLEKRQAVEFLIKMKISSPIAACSFLHVCFLFAGTYCISYESQSPILHMMTFVAGSRFTAVFPCNLIFFQLENSMEFVPLKFYVFCFVLMVFSHLLYILALVFFLGDI